MAALPNLNARRSAKKVVAQLPGDTKATHHGRRKKSPKHH